MDKSILVNTYAMYTLNSSTTWGGYLVRVHRRVASHHKQCEMNWRSFNYIYNNGNHVSNLRWPTAVFILIIIITYSFAIILIVV